MLSSRLGFAALLLVSSLTLPGQTPAADKPTGMRARVLRMTEFLDTMLPGTLGAKNITLHFTPKFSDFRDEQYTRYPVELRYGVNDKIDLSGGIVPFAPNPFRSASGADHRWGPGELRFGGRYDLGAQLFFDDTTIGLENRIPLGKPPVGLNDHYTHVKPFLALARTLKMWPDTTLYTNVSYDRSVILTRRGPPPPIVTRRQVIDVWPGMLFKQSELGYFAEYRFSHITEPVDWHLAHEFRFGTIWDVPIERTEKWKLPGKWQVEFAYKIGHEEGYDSDHGIFARVNWRTTLREVLTSPNPLTAKRR
jgi:hypothetical protein